jgi:hypothetical protein
MPKVSVFSSKQKPRKLSLIGSDMQEYPFLLKGWSIAYLQDRELKHGAGHEDLRLDERVMQFLELSNRIFRKDRACRGMYDAESDIISDANAVRRLKCTLYSVVPLSSDAGLLTWLRNKDVSSVRRFCVAHGRGRQCTCSSKSFEPRGTFHWTKSFATCAPLRPNTTPYRTCKSALLLSCCLPC